MAAAKTNTRCIGLVSVFAGMPGEMRGILPIGVGTRPSGNELRRWVALNHNPLLNPHPHIMIGGMGPKKTLRMVAQYADACNFFEGVGTENMQKALDTLKAHCEKLERDYSTIEKTSLGTVHLSGDDTVDGTIRRTKDLSEMGFTHAIFNMPDVYKITPLKTFAKEIIPAVAEL